MPYGNNTITCKPFSREAFEEVVLGASRAPEGQSPNQQTRYLSGYLDNDLRVKTLLVEDHYIDRHFIEEFSTYYSRCFAPVSNACKRIHAFTTALSDGDLDTLIARAASGELEAVQAQLQDSYRGFVVVRPLPSVPIGRTALAYPEDLESRK